MLSKWRTVRKITKWKNSNKLNDDHNDDALDNKHLQVKIIYFLIKKSRKKTIKSVLLRRKKVFRFFRKFPCKKKFFFKEVTI